MRNNEFDVILHSEKGNEVIAMDKTAQKMQKFLNG